MASKLKLTELLYPTSTTPAITINADDTVTFGAPTTTITNISTTSITDSGNLTFTGTGNRIRGDFSNGTLVNRVTFQTSTANSATSVQAIPNGTGNTATFLTANGTDVDNSSIFQFQATNTDNRLNANKLGTGTYLPMTFYTGGSEAMRITTDRNVGIGTISPAYKLDVNTTGGSVATARLLGNDQANVRLRFENSGGRTWELVGGLPGANNTNFSLRDVTGGTTPLTVDSSGNVGIGTPTPSQKLDVRRAGTAGVIANFTDGTAQSLHMTTGSGYFGFLNPNNGALTFRNSTDTGEYARIDSSGNLLVGTTGAFNSVNGVGIFRSGGNWQLLALRNTGAGNGSMINVSTATTAGIGWDTGVEGAGAINWSWRYDTDTKATINSSTGAYTAVSDINKKKNLEASSVGLDAVMRIEPTLFHMTSDADDAPKHLGFIAQQVEPLIPQAYVENNGFIGLQDRPIIAALVKAIQEQQALIQDLTTRLTTLEGN